MLPVRCPPLHTHRYMTFLAVVLITTVLFHCGLEKQNINWQHHQVYARVCFLVNDAVTVGFYSLVRQLYYGRDYNDNMTLAEHAM